MCYDITLEQGQSDDTCSPGVISSGAMGPCIAIGIFDALEQRGYMIHESNAHVNTTIPGFLDNVLNNTENDNLVVCVAGGGIDPLEDPDDEFNINDDIQASRDYVIGELEIKFRDDQIEYHWNNGNGYIELHLNTGTGEFEIE